MEPSPYDAIIRRAVAKLNMTLRNNGNRDDDDFFQEARIALWKAEQRYGVDQLDPALAFTVAHRAGVDYMRKLYGRKKTTERESGREFRAQPLSIDKFVEDIGYFPGYSVPANNTELLFEDFEQAVSGMKASYQILARAYARDGMTMREAANLAGYRESVGTTIWHQNIKPVLKRKLEDHDIGKGAKRIPSRSSLRHNKQRQRQVAQRAREALGATESPQGATSTGEAPGGAPVAGEVPRRVSPRLAHLLG